MRRLPHGKLTMGIGVLSIVGLIFLLGGATEAAAQQRRGGPQLDPEKAQAAWTLAARGVANDLKLSKQVTSKLIDAYKAARESYQKAMQGLSGGGGGFQGFRELAEKERGKLETALKGFLNDKQAAEAIASLGTFNGEWDRFLDVIAGFKLDDKKLFTALALVRTYVVDYDKARRSAMADQDWQSIRTARETHKAALDGGLSKILTPSQLITWNEATAPRRRG